MALKRGMNALQAWQRWQFAIERAHRDHTKALEAARKEYNRTLIAIAERDKAKAETKAKGKRNVSRARP
jgi:hypothetical protein